jgi:hypothetical protein
VDINNWAPYCSPITPYRNPQNVNGYIDEILRYEGSLQWYRIDEPGSYSIDAIPVNPTNVQIKYDLFEARDLGLPLKDYDGTFSEYGRKFVMPDPPYYFRVFSQNRFKRNIEYKIQFHKHAGESWEDAIIMLPYDTLEMKWPNPILNPENCIWFEFNTDIATGGEFIFPEVTFEVYGEIIGNSTDMFKMQLVQISNGKEIPVKKFRENFNSDIRKNLYTDNLVHEELKKGKYYIKLSPLITLPGDHEFNIVLKTTLTYFKPLFLSCLDQTDLIGDEETHYTLEFDNTGLILFQYIGDFDPKQKPHGLHNIIPEIRLVDNFSFTLNEKDYLENPVDIFIPFKMDFKNRPLLQTEKFDSTYIWKTEFKKSDGLYFLQYYLGHRPYKY